MAISIAGATSAFAQPRPYPESYLRYAGDPTKQTDPAHKTPGILKDVTFQQQLNEQLPLDAAFKDETGRDVRLGDYFKTGKPVVLAFVYYQCTMLCTQVMNGISSALKPLTFTPGQDFDVVLVSFDPRDTPGAAAKKKAAYLDEYKRPGAAEGWHFLTGDEANIRRLTDAAGFKYSWDEATKQFVHATGVMVLTPSGELARYFYGVEFPPRDLRFGLIEAADGRIGTPVDQVLLACFHYDPTTGQYSLLTMTLVRAGGIATLLVLGTFMFVSVRRERRTRERGAGGQP